MKPVTRIRLFLVILAAFATCVEAQQKPIVTSRAATRFRVPPNSLKEMATVADAVVRVKVVGHSPRNIPIGGTEMTRPVTVFRATVLNVLRAFGTHGVTPDEITIVMAGGDRDRGAYIERTFNEGFPALELGHDYVLFLTWNSALDDWVPAFGPDSVWDITQGRVESAGRSKVTRKYKRMMVVDALQQLRTLGKP